MKLKSRYLIKGGPAEGEQLPNVFHYYGEKLEDGHRFIGLLQEGQTVPDPEWILASELFENFEIIK